MRRSRAGGAAGSIAALATAASLWLSILGATDTGPVRRLPDPTGPHAVGTTLVRWTDSSRSIAGGPRELPVRVWYPAERPGGRGGEAAPYVLNLDRLRPLVGAAYARRLEGIEPYARLDAPPLRAEVPFPSVVFSHGLGSLPALYTTLAEDLASHGWAVFSVSHPGGARGVVTSDGRALPLTPEWSEPAPHEELFARTVREWSRDQRFAIDRVRRLAVDEAGSSLLAGRLDPERIAAVGHSLGASSAVLTGQVDPDVGAVVSLEGTVRAQHHEKPVTGPLLLMRKDAELLRREQTARALGLDARSLDAFLARLQANAEELRARAAVCVPIVRVRRAHHNHFGDWPLVFGEPRGMENLIDGRRAARLVSAHVRVFLDRSLGRAHGGLAGLGEAFPEAERLDGCPRDAPTESGVRAVGGTKLFVKTFGAGDPMIVVHGGPSIGHGYLLPGMLELARDRRLIFYDQRGIGRSAGASDSARLGMESNVRDLEGLRASLGLERIDLLGHSFGAGLAAAYAVRYPSRVGSLVLMNPVPPGRRHQAALRKALEARRTTRDSAELARLFRSDGFREGKRAVVDRIYELTYRPWFDEPALASRLSFGLDREAAERGRRVARIVVGNSRRLGPWNDLDAVRDRALVVHGARDPIPIEGARELAERIPGARFVAIPGSGHFPFVEAPGPLFRAIGDFLRSGRGGG